MVSERPADNSWLENSPTARFALDVVKQLRDHGYQALFAGGCVRDFLLGFVPKDYDVATDAGPREVRKLFGHRRTQAVGAAFGVVIVHGSRREGAVEVATFRRDGVYSDGRHPDKVTFSSPTEDAQRRDFTINGLFYDPIAGRTIDYVEGQADLEKRVVRAIGDPYARFGEDKLRMLRAVRFAAALEFQLDPQTLSAIQQQAAQIRQVSAERVAAELRRMLGHPQRRRAAELLSESRLLGELLPVAWQLEQRHVLPAALDTLEHLPGATSSTVSLAVLVQGLDPMPPGGPDAWSHAVRDHWRLTNQEAARLTWLWSTIPQVRRADDLAWPQLQPLLVGRGTADLMAWLRAEVSAGLVAHQNLDACQKRLALPADQLNPAPLISGNDLRKLGIAPGPLYRDILTEVRNAQLAGALRDKPQALAFVSEHWRGEI